MVSSVYIATGEIIEGSPPRRAARLVASGSPSTRPVRHLLGEGRQRRGDRYIEPPGTSSTLLPKYVPYVMSRSLVEVPRPNMVDSVLDSGVRVAGVDVVERLAGGVAHPLDPKDVKPVLVGFTEHLQRGRSCENLRHLRKCARIRAGTNTATAFACAPRAS